MTRKLLLILTILLLIPNLVFGAIAYDTDSEWNVDGASTLSQTFTVGAGSNRLLVVVITVEDSTAGDHAVDIITYAGVAMTSAVSLLDVADSSRIFYLIAPTSGANTLAITWGGTLTGCEVNASAWTGVKQSAQPDATNSQLDATSDGAITTSITTVAANSLIIDCLISSTDAAVLTPAVAQTQMHSVNTINHGSGSSYRAVTTAGAYDMTWTYTPNSTKKIHTLASFSPVVASTTVPQLIIVGGD